MCGRCPTSGAGWAGDCDDGDDDDDDDDGDDGDGDDDAVLGPGIQAIGE